MGSAVITVRVMPESPETDLEAVQEKAIAAIKVFAGEGDTKSEQKPIAFGLKALDIMFVMDENKGSPDPVAEEIAEFDDVRSCEVTDVRRAIG